MSYLLLVAGAPLIIYGCYVIYHVVNNKRQQAIENIAYESPVSIILACYNEAHYVAERIASFLLPGNWIEGSELIIVSGGSTDGTSEILAQYALDSRVKVFVFKERLSKIQAVNWAVGESKHEILIFSDCRQIMERGSVPALVRHFFNPQIGTVSATLHDNLNQRQVSLSRAILNAIAFSESRKNSSHNVFGALYAQRRECFKRIPENILFDDLFVVVSTLAQGFRLVQTPYAVICDVPMRKYYRKNRILRLSRGMLLFLLHHRSLIFSLSRKELVLFFINKYLKLFIPFSTIVLIHYTFFHLLWSNWVAYVYVSIVLLIAFFIKCLRDTCVLFFQYNIFLLLGFYLFLVGKERSVLWDKLESQK